MFNSINKLKNLPPETKVYCGHEYTKKNSEFCLKYDPKNLKLIEKINLINSQRNKNLPTIPTTIQEEKETNIFLRCNLAEVKKNLNMKDQSDHEIFHKLRDLKDTF